MGLTETIRNLFGKQKVPETEEYQLFKACRELNLEDIQRFKNYIVHYAGIVEKCQERNNSTYKEAIENLHRFQYSLYEAEKTTEFIRPNNKEDIDYRNQLFSFPTRLKEVLPQKLDLRFHGTPIYFAKEILKSGSISSSADRFGGYIRSTDECGEFSVSDINSLSRTVNYFLDITAFERSLPCGCLFVLTSEGQSEEQRGRSVMNKLDFNQEPERLYAIVTTPENIHHVKEWLRDSDLSERIVHTFDEFIQEIEKVRFEELGQNTSLNEKITEASGMCSSCSSVNCKQDIIR